MKRVVSISLGSSKRDHEVETVILGEKFRIQRIGTDGDMERAVALIRELDGKVDAFGMGGIDLYIYAGDKRYTLREAVKLAEAAQKTPIVDGSGLKNTLERRVITYLQHHLEMDLAGKKVLMVCALDRFGMAEALVQAGCQVTFGDLIFALGIPIPIRSLETLRRLARMLVPVVSRLPFKYLYPTGVKQEKGDPRFDHFYQEAEIVAGDFHYIRRYLPERLSGQIILTNTVTSADIELLRQRGAKTLITTTPELNGRSFGTNVMEGILVAFAGKDPDSLTPADYERLLDAMGFRARVIDLKKASA